MNSLRILIADDDRDTVLTPSMLLTDEGHDVRGVYSGRHVMGCVIDFDPHVIVLDINLPARSGWGVARSIRERCGKERPLLIGISGEYKHGADQLLSQSLGFNHYLLRPYEPTALIGLIDSLGYSGPA